MLQQANPDDYVIGTGESHSVEEFIEEAFAYVQLDWRDYVTIDPRYFRPSETDYLRADITKARRELNWSPTVTFHDLVKIMMDADLRAAGLEAPGEGEKVLLNKGFDWMEMALSQVLREHV
jgi:GDPmannose 4,6-dehydratase